MASQLFSPYDVFISYKSDDRKIAEGVQRLLEQHGLKVWRDERLKDAAGLAYDKTINDALDLSARVLVLWSKKAIESDWVRGEAAKGKDQGKYVPLLIEPCKDQLPAVFRHDQYLKFNLDDTDIADLLRALGVVNGTIAGVTVAAITQPLTDLDHLPNTHTGELFGREAELREMAAAWDGHDCHVFIFDAIGGTGKTALLHHFLHGQLIPASWRGCRAAFAYSFYSQGSTEDKQVDADEFFAKAFALFGQTAHGLAKQQAFADAKTKAEAEQRGHLERAQLARSMGNKALAADCLAKAEAVKFPDAWPPTEAGKKGPALAELIQAQRSLLILDGLEPIQYVAGKSGGEKDQSFATGHFGGIKDLDVKILLQKLGRFNPGLCLVSTRVPVTELGREYQFVRHEKLAPLAAEPATRLLLSLGVEPKLPRRYEDLTERTKEEFAGAVARLEGHALALNIAGRWVAQHREGQLRAIADLPVIEMKNLDASYRSPFRVMRMVELGLRKQMSAHADPYQSTAARQLALLFFLGLFDRPAGVDLIEVVFGEKQVPKRFFSLFRRIARLFFGRPLPLHLDRLFAVFDSANRDQIRFALSQMSRQGLVQKVKNEENASAAWERNDIDCHPLIREYFGERLRELDPAAFRAAHGRLYDHYRFAGLPEEFRDPVAYAALALKSSFPDHVERLLNDIVAKRVRAAERGVIPATLLEASVESVRSAQSALSNDSGTALAAFRPETAGAMEPLFAAITHGCLAERQDECFKEVYWPRIARGNEKFAVKKLGLYGQELAAVASFFARPFASPSPNLNPSDQALVLNMAGFALRAIGRLPDAVEPFAAAAEMPVETQDWKRAASGYGTLSELLVTLGRLEDEPAGEASSRAAGALSTAARAVEFADQSGDLFQKLMWRSNALGAALLASGDLAGAEARFREAERLQAQRQPGLPRLYSVQGFLYGDLLLSRARAAEVAERVAYSLPLHEQNKLLLAIGLDQLNQARAAVLLAPSGSGPAPLAAFPAARDALQKANVEHHLIRGYLAHAEALLHAAEAGDAADPRAIAEALTEAETIATRGPMPLFLAEAKLLRARAARLAGDRAAAQSCRDEAARLIAQHRYGRRRPDLAVLDAEWEALGFRREAAGEASAPAGAAFHRACEAVAAGWWHLLPRLERLAAHHPAICDAALVADLRTKEAAYNAERDAYLAEQDSPDPEPDEANRLDGLMGMMHEVILDQLPAEVIAQVAQQTGLPADWRQWPEEVKAHVAKLWLEA